MNLQQIEYVLAVAELGSFGKAADKCFVTQSTLSTMVARLEEELGIRIFDRKTKPISTTKEGEALVFQLNVISKELGALSELAQTLKGELSGEVKMGVIPTVAPYILPRFLNGFANKFPKLRFTVSELITESIIELLRTRELDIGIAALPMENDSLVEIPLYNETFVLYDCRPGPAQQPASLEDLDFEDLWLLEEGHCLHSQVKKICDYDNCKDSDKINFDYKAGSIDSLIRFVKMENGITLLPQLSILDFGEEEMRKVGKFKHTAPERTIGLVVHKHFAKKQIAELLEREIKGKVLPLLDKVQ